MPKFTLDEHIKRMRKILEAGAGMGQATTTSTLQIVKQAAQGITQKQRIKPIIPAPPQAEMPPLEGGKLTPKREKMI